MQFPKKTPEYEDLKQLREPWGIVYGPLSSRRLGQSLGINLLGSGPKTCSYDCPYCELGFTTQRMRDIKTNLGFPSIEQLENELRAQLSRAEQSTNKIDAICFVGNGEPTLHPQFEEAVDIVLKVRTEMAPSVRVGILTNGATLDNRRIVNALNKLDDRMVKLDAGNDEMLKRINNPLVRINVTKIIAGTKKLKDVILQCMFLQGTIDNTTPKEIEDWIECVGLVAPRVVHIYSLARVPAMEGLRMVSEDKLDVIAAQLERRTRIRATVF